MRFIKSTVIFYVIYMVLDYLWGKIAPLPGPADDLSFDSVERMLYLTLIVTVIMLLWPLVALFWKPKPRRNDKLDTLD